MFLQLMVLRRETHKSKTHNMYSNNTNHRAKRFNSRLSQESFKTSEVPSAIFWHNET